MSGIKANEAIQQIQQTAETLRQLQMTMTKTLMGLKHAGTRPSKAGAGLTVHIEPVTLASFKAEADRQGLTYYRAAEQALEAWLVLNGPSENA